MLVLDCFEETERAIQTLRAATHVEHELILVDNGSTDPRVVALIDEHADVLIRNATNLGVPRGWNQGLQVARGEFVAIANNDIRFPDPWFEPLSESLRGETAGMVVPVSEGGGKVQVRDPALPIVRLDPFGPTPHGFLMLLRTAALREVGGFCEVYKTASNEDKDLCFTLWERGRDVVVDHRVDVHHEVGATWRRTLGAWRARRLFKRNRKVFKKRWKHRLKGKGD